MSVSNVKEYWSNRYAKQGYLTTGYNGHNEKQMQENYKERFEWLNNRLPNKRDNVLDYGCGTGRYVGLFGSGYVGYDISKQALSMAQDLHPNKTFLNFEPLTCEVLFTSTVLQHNTDKEVKRILDKYSYAREFWLYEFTGESKAAHMASRTVGDYERLSGKDIKFFYSHVTHGEQHSLMILE